MLDPWYGQSYVGDADQDVLLLDRQTPPSSMLFSSMSSSSGSSSSSSTSSSSSSLTSSSLLTPPPIQEDDKFCVNYNFLKKSHTDQRETGGKDSSAESHVSATHGSRPTQTIEHELKVISEFSEQFRNARLKLGKSQETVGIELEDVCGRRASQTTISRFESRNLSFKNMKDLAKVLKVWLNQCRSSSSCSSSIADVEFGSHFYTTSPFKHIQKPRRKRSNLNEKFTQEQLLMSYEKCCTPPEVEMSRLSHLLQLDYQVIKSWFANKRQKDKRGGKTLTASQKKMRVRNLCHEPSSTSRSLLGNDLDLPRVCEEYEKSRLPSLRSSSGDVAPADDSGHAIGAGCVEIKADESHEANVDLKPPPEKLINLCGCNGLLAHHTLARPQTTIYYNSSEPSSCNLTHCSSLPLLFGDQRGQISDLMTRFPTNVPQQQMACVFVLPCSLSPCVAQGHEAHACSFTLQFPLNLNLCQRRQFSPCLFKEATKCHEQHRTDYHSLMPAENSKSDTRDFDYRYLHHYTNVMSANVSRPRPNAKIFDTSDVSCDTIEEPSFTDTITSLDDLEELEEKKRREVIKFISDSMNLNSIKCWDFPESQVFNSL